LGGRSEAIVIRPWRPSQAGIDAQLSRSDQPFNYREVGATAGLTSFEAIAVNYDIDRHRVRLGTGRDLFERARSALLAWRHFEIPWLELQGTKTQVSLDQVVATLTRASGLWFLNPCRVVYMEGTSNPSTEAAFAYGTLSGHVERGEERFAVHFDPSTGEVSYRVLAFSRPAVLVSKLGRPWVRRLQKRFAIASADALARACRPTSSS
jgi:uncharacterized protein (UPF0548 family)